jgi:TRAP-type C4-dicarboxylate transport system permease small subunit
MKRFSRGVEIFENVFLTFGILASVSISVVGVFFRYVIESSLSWVEEMAGFLLLIVITVGIGAAVRRGSHLRVDMIIQFIPRTKKSLDFIADLVALGIMTILFILSIDFVFDLLARDQRTGSIYWLPIGVAAVIMPLGYLAAVWRVIENLSARFKKKTE